MTLVVTHPVFLLSPEAFPCLGVFEFRAINRKMKSRITWLGVVPCCRQSSPNRRRGSSSMRTDRRFFLRYLSSSQSSIGIHPFWWARRPGFPNPALARPYSFPYFQYSREGGVKSSQVSVWGN